MGVQLANSIYGVLLSAYFAAVIPLAVLLFRHRGEQPIQGRGWVLTMIATAGGAMMFSVVCFRQPDPSIFPCSVYVLASNLFFSLFFLPYIFRAFKVLYIQYVTLVENHDDDGTKRVIYDRSRRFSDRCNVFFYLVAVLISIAVGVWMVYYVSATQSGIRVLVERGNGTTTTTGATVEEDMMHVGCAFGGEFVPFALISAGYVLVFVVFYLLLRRVDEDLAGSCRELRWCLSLWIPCTVAFFVCNLWEPLFWFDDVIPFSSWILIMIVGTNMISLLQPVMQTYSPYTSGIVSRMTERAQVTSYERVSSIMKDPVARDILHQWMLANAEKDVFFFEFLNEVRLYQARTPASRWDYSLEIKRKYLERDSPTYVANNIIVAHMAIFTTAWQGSQRKVAAPAAIFEQISTDICAYLQDTIMIAFLQSPTYRDELLSRTAVYHATLDSYQDHGLVAP